MIGDDDGGSVFTNGGSHSGGCLDVKQAHPTERAEIDATTATKHAQGSLSALDRISHPDPGERQHEVGNEHPEEAKTQKPESGQ
jgi:hypothetical protein